MSNFGQIALIVVGTVVGAFFDNPELGFALGSLAGSALFPTQLPQGPRISDNRTTSATLGGAVPIIFGTCDVAGTIMYLAPYVEHSSESGGKGGPEQKVFNYTQTIGIGLAERVDDDADPSVGAIAGISRIFENGQIVYDIRPQLAANSDLNQAAETDLAYQNRLAASAIYAETFTLYLGTEEQMPDPTIEAVEGYGNVPAFRGLAYIVYPNRALQESQGLRHPNFTFEVFADGATGCTTVGQYSTDILYPWNPDIGQDPTNTQNVNTFRFVSCDNAFYLETDSSTEWSTLGAAFQDLFGPSKYNCDMNVCLGVIVETGSATPTLGGSDALDRYMGSTVDLPYGSYDPQIVRLVFSFEVPQNFYGYYQGSINYHLSGTPPGGTFYQQGQINQQTAIPFPADGTPAPPPAKPYLYTGELDPGCYFYFMQSIVMQVTRNPAKPPAPCFGLPPAATAPGFATLPDGRIIECNDWTLETTSPLGYKCLSPFSPSRPGNAYSCQYPLGPVHIYTDPEWDDEAYWTAQYNLAVGRGAIQPGLHYPSDYPVAQSHAWVINQTICIGSGGAARVDNIIAAICKRAGVTQIDTSDLSSYTVPGYSISSVCDGADVISPLRSVAFFDAVESGDVLRFVSRGKAIVATLTEDQFGCFEGGSGDGSSQSTVPPAITTVRADETTLPRSIRLHFKAVTRDYQDGEADSPFRLTTLSVDDQDVSLPICMGDLQAAQVADILWSDAWSAQTTHELSVDQSLLWIEVGDAIGVPINDVIQRVRIVSDSNASGVLRKLSTVRDDEGSYISYAVASPPAYSPPTLGVVAPTSYELMDLPALQDADSDPGFYIAMQRQYGAGNKWAGAAVYKSIDSGATYTSLFGLGTEADNGTLTLAVPASDTHTWDAGTLINITCPESFSFESRTDDAVIAGANAAAMGKDGRWEIVQFANATKIDATHWQLSRLLRGRRGTEWVLGTSQVGDSFVMVSGGDLGRIPLQVAEIGATRNYDVVSSGLSFATGIVQSFAGHAMALRPFSPGRLRADLETDGDYALSWIRRDRLGHTLTPGADVPMSETVEQYQVDICSDPTYFRVLRTLTTGMPSVNYTAAMQSADGFSAPLYFAVYQISSTYGRGTGARYPDQPDSGNGSGGGGLPAESARSHSTAYLANAKAGYPGWNDPSNVNHGVLLEWRFRFPGSNLVMDVQGFMTFTMGTPVPEPESNSLAYGTSIISRFDDGSTTYAARINANRLVWADKDPAETRYIYVSRLYGGGGSSGAGIIQKIDSQQIVDSPVHDLVAAATSYPVGATGDPRQILQIGSVVWAYCSYNSQVIKFNASDLSQITAFNIGYAGIPKATFLMRGPSGSLWAYTQTPSEVSAGVHSVSQLDPTTLGIISTFQVSQGSGYSLFEGVIVGNYLYAVIGNSSSSGAAVAKFDITTGIKQSFVLEMHDTESSLFNYIQADGTEVSVGRYPIVYTIDTTTDMITVNSDGN